MKPAAWFSGVLLLLTALGIAWLVHGQADARPVPDGIEPILDTLRTARTLFVDFSANGERWVLQYSRRGEMSLDRVGSADGRWVFKRNRLWFVGGTEGSDPCPPRARMELHPAALAMLREVRSGFAHSRITEATPPIGHLAAWEDYYRIDPPFGEALDLHLELRVNRERRRPTELYVLHADGREYQTFRRTSWPPVPEVGNLSFVVTSFRVDVPLESGAFTFAPLSVAPHGGPLLNPRGGLSNREGERCEQDDRRHVHDDQLLAEHTWFDSHGGGRPRTATRWSRSCDFDPRWDYSEDGPIVDEPDELDHDHEDGTDDPSDHGEGNNGNHGEGNNGNHGEGDNGNHGDGGNHGEGNNGNGNGGN